MAPAKSLFSKGLLWSCRADWQQGAGKTPSRVLVPSFWGDL